MKNVLFITLSKIYYMGLELSGILGQESPNYSYHMPLILFSSIRPCLACKNFFLCRYNIDFPKFKLSNFSKP